MKQIVMWTLSALICVAPLAAQPQLPLAGEWQLDPAKNTPPPKTALKLTIVQTGDTIELHRQGPTGKSVATHSLREESSNASRMGNTRSRAGWEGTKLVIAGWRTLGDGQQAPMRQVIRLSPDGQYLTIDEVISTNTTEFKSSEVFSRNH
jgi:hypothetical protein